MLMEQRKIELKDPKEYGISYEEVSTQVRNRMCYRILNRVRYPDVEAVKDLIEIIKTTKMKGSKNYHRSTPEVIADVLFFPEKYNYIFDKREEKVEKVESRVVQRTGMNWLAIKKHAAAKFGESPFKEKYKSLDEFVTFATKEEIALL